jgi:pilus assembly protein CpaE
MMPLLVEADTATAGVLMSSLPTGTQVLTHPQDVTSWLSSRPDYAVAIGPTLALAEATAVAEHVRSVSPMTTVVLIRHDLEPHVYAVAMSAGVGAVVASDDGVSLIAATTRARAGWESVNGPAATGGTREGRVVTVFSPKGGVGKTTMSVNLGVALAQAGSEVCVVDLDLAFGDVAITLQIVPEHTIAEATDSEADMDFALIESLLTRHPSSLSILAAPTHPEGRDRITPSLVRRIIQTLRTRFDFVIIDTPPGFDDQVLGAFDETDECVVVATLDVPTIKNTRVALETLDLLHLVPNHRHLVLNRADEEVGLKLANVEDILGMKVAVSLPSALAVATATNHGQPIVLSKPDHAVSQGIAALARRLQGASAAPTASAPVKRGLFGRQKKRQEVR